MLARHRLCRLRLIDQRKLPGKLEMVYLTSVEAAAEAIKNMTVRGAPAIGAAGAFALVLVANGSRASSGDALLRELRAAKRVLDAARPTAVNLSWATGHIVDFIAEMAASGHFTVEEMRTEVGVEAANLAELDVRVNKRMAEFGAALVPKGANILHHCNTGALATVDIGTAIGVIYECHHTGKGIHVWVDETRPRLQGARLSAWELMRDGVPIHLIADNAAGLLMQQGKVDIVLVGADRVAANGDTANKIGTYKLAVCAREHGIPFYPVVPTSTIDLSTLTGDKIPIEERGAEEVTRVGGSVVAPAGCPVFNPAFDMTPARYITGIITEEGVCYPPYSVSLRAAVEAAERRIHDAFEKRIAGVRGGRDKSGATQQSARSRL